MTRSAFKGWSETIPDEQIGNRIEIYGDISLGSNCAFSAEPGESWDGLYLYDTGSSSFSNCNFENSGLHSDSRNITIANSSFENSKINVHNSSLELNNVSLDNSPIDAFCTIESDNLVKLHNNCMLTNTTNNSALEITNYPNFIIKNNTISNCYSGIYIFESGSSIDHTIENNIINGCNNGCGISLYHSYTDIIGHNVIYDNYTGLSAMRNSNFVLIGSEEYPLQIIRNNEENEVCFTYDSRPGDFNFNKIYDDNHNDSYVYCREVPLIHESVDIANNNWGENFDPELDLYPYELYDYLPIWEPGDPRDPGGDPAKSLYLSGKQYEESCDLQQAELTYKQVISDYPASDYALISAKELLALEEKNNEDYYSLKTYYQTEPNFQYNENTIKLSEYLINYCDLKLENFPEVIGYLEDVIINPPTFADSVFAVIDAGYTYLLMENTGRSNFIGQMANLKPKSRKDFEYKRDELLSGLLGNNGGNENQNEIPQVAVLNNNYPNPFNPITTISFSIPVDGKVDLSIYNIKGQKVKTLIHDEFERGSHQVIWNSKDNTGKSVATGIYFYKMRVNSKDKSIKKMLLLK